MVVGDLLTRNAVKFPDHIAIRQGGVSVTYKTLNERANCIANALLARGLGKGGRVGVLLDNVRQFIEIYFAVAKAGAVFCPINPMLREKELADIMGYLTPDFLFLQAPTLGLIDSITDTVNLPEHIFCLERPYSRKGRGERYYDYEAIAAEGDTSEPPITIRDDDVMSIFLTSGTTGKPMGAMRTHRHLITTAHSVALEERIYYDERVLMVSPLYHVSFEGNLGRCFVFPNTAVILEGPFDPEAVLGILSKERITVGALVPTMINALVRYPDIASFDLSSLRLIVYASSPMPVELLKKALSIFQPLGVRFLQHYGLTESGPSMTVLPPEDHVLTGSNHGLTRLASAGRPILDCCLRIVDEGGRDVAPGVVGEIIGKGETIMKGYWNLPAETADKIRDGWLYTGDLGKADEEGYIYLVDRKGDMIIRGGKNIYPREIEEMLYTFPGVIEAAVIGVPDDLWGESVKALIVMRQGISISKGDIINFLSHRLAEYKKPQSIEFLATLPKNPQGKILKRALREKYWAGSGRRL